MDTEVTLTGMGTLLDNIEVAPLDVGDLGVSSKDKDIFATQQRKGWDKSVEARCDFTRKVRLTRRGGVFFISLWQKSVFGRTLTDIKADDSMVYFFAEQTSELIKEFIGSSLDKGDWAICTSPNSSAIYAFLAVSRSVFICSSDIFAGISSTEVPSLYLAS
jgi:hypothetical protein